jgi:predicted nucleic acid-binding protein
MRYLLDTSILLRYVNPGDPQHEAVMYALTELIARGEDVYITTQNLIEFRFVATRPAGEGSGLGWTPTQASQQCAFLELTFGVLPDVPPVLARWKQIVDTEMVVGRQVYDARLAAVALTHNVSYILTLNDADFACFERFGVIPVHPSHV